MKIVANNKRYIGSALLLLVIVFSLSGLILDLPVQTQHATSVIIGFKNKVDAELIVANGGTITESFVTLNAVVASISPKAIDTLRSNPNVAYVEIDSKVEALEQYTPWDVIAVDAPVVWETGNKGNGVKIAVLDTGIAIGHPDLRVAGGASFVLGTRSYNDDNGHGTHVAGIIAALDNDIGVVGIAPAAELYAVKVMDWSGSSTISNIIKGIDWSINNEMQIISMSLGSTFDSASLRAAVNRAYDAGIVVVAAAGNDGPKADTVSYPARYSSVIAVAATDNNDNVARFSSRGPELSIAAPGVNVYSTYVGNSYASLNGTSMATPTVAGIVALMLKAGTYTPDEVKDILQKTAIDLGPPGFDYSYGYGRVNATAAVEAILENAPSPPTSTPDFAVSIDPPVLNVEAGSYTELTLVVTSLNEFSGTTNLTASAPSDWKVTFSQPSMTIVPENPATATIAIAVPSFAATGTYSIAVTGTSGSLTRTAIVAVNVQTVRDWTGSNLP